MTTKQRMTINRQIGVLDGLAWIALTDEKYRAFSNALEVVTESLAKLLEEEEEYERGQELRRNLSDLCGH